MAFSRAPLDGGHLLLRLDYQVSRTGEAVSLAPSVEALRPVKCGARWLFHCPLVVNGRPCTRRAVKLYLPPGSSYFGCRACHLLTYRSAQEHDKRVDALLRAPEGLLARALSGTTQDLMLAIRALHKECERSARWRRANRLVVCKSLVVARAPTRD